MARTFLGLVFLGIGIAGALFANGTASFIRLIGINEYDPGKGQVFYEVRHNCPADITARPRFDIARNGRDVLSHVVFHRTRAGSSERLDRSEVSRLCSSVHVRYSNPDLTYGREDDGIVLEYEPQLVNRANGFTNSSRIGFTVFENVAVRRSYGVGEVVLNSFVYNNDKLVGHPLTVALNRRLDLLRSVPNEARARNVWLQNHYDYELSHRQSVLVRFQDTESEGIRELLMIVAGFMIGAALTSFGLAVIDLTSRDSTLPAGPEAEPESGVK